MLAPNTSFETRRTRSPSRSGVGSHRAQSVSPVGLTIAQRQAQLAAYVASTAASDVGRVAVTTDAMRNVAQQALEIASQATKTASQSEAHACKLFANLRDELRTKFNKDHVADETRRRQAETWMAALGASIESLQKRMNEMNVPDVKFTGKTGAEFAADDCKKFC